MWNEEQKVPYAYSNKPATQQPGGAAGIEWIGFDDVRSIEYKMRYVRDMQLGGAMLWALDMDDFTGEFCSQGKYPILNAVNYFLFGSGNGRDLPRADVLWKRASNNGSEKPEIEGGRLVQPDTRETGKFLASHSVNEFGLLRNDAMLTYRFCQCKNGTHKIFMTRENEASGKFSFAVDCNEKRVYFPTSRIEQAYENKELIEYGREGDSKNKNIWSIFGISSPAKGLHQSERYSSIGMSVLLAFLFIQNN